MPVLDANTLSVDWSNDTDTLNQATQRYQQYGCFLAKNLLPAKAITAVQADIQKLIQLRAKAHNLTHLITGDRFDDGFMGMNQQDREHGAIIYRACDRLLSVHKLSVHAEITRIAQHLIQTDTLISSTVKGVRIDHPHENKYLFDWHQDYPYIMDSLDALVFWVPLQTVSEHNGWLTIAPGSNQLGILPLTVAASGNADNNKSGFMHIANPSPVNNYPHIPIPAEPGDVLVFNTLLLHRSGQNQSDHARWTVQVRFGNFEHPVALNKNWPGTLRDGLPFEHHHPEWITPA